MTDQSEQLDVTPPGAPQPDVPTPPPAENKGSGQHAVFDLTLGQFVSGVGDKKTATAAKKSVDAARKESGIHKDNTTEVREV